MKPNFFQRLVMATKFMAGRPIGKRSYLGGQITRLSNDLPTVVTSADFELRNVLGILRTRSRDLEQNNDYGESFFKLMENNIVGPDGVALHMMVKDPDGKIDSKANETIEAAWKKWGKKKNCTVTRQDSWLDAKRLIIRSVARDGSVLIRKRPGFDNEFGFAIQLLEADHLDRYYNGFAAETGNEVRMGIEINQYREPVAYWIIPRHPGDFLGYAGAYARERVPADQIIHLYFKTRVEQSEGVPWLVTSLARLARLGKYEQAEVDRAYEASCKGGFIENQVPETFEGEKDDNGNSVENVESGMIQELLPGQKFVAYDPNHPTEAYQFFVKGQLRGVASGGGVSYNSLANDLEGVNYSSIRTGKLDERDQYKKIQNWFIESLCEEVFQAWLPHALLSKQIDLPMSKFEKFNAPTWKGRRWSWVDPQKDIQASILAVDRGFTSRQRVIAETGGGTVEDIDREQQEDKKLDAKHGLDFTEKINLTPPKAQALEDKTE